PAPAPKKNSSKCSALGCTDRAVKIVGDCRYCASKFCSRHRLPEAHACPNIQSCRQDATARLSDRLMGEKCVASKV
ncbi:uncharacterized protein BJ171DRAFT_408729, partial [Polychytrium aggregatum]|uniref:uncharacterized protein n=1 Tax=Polychytrium aggregatum TaxID=110093 RepID=UPI0022FE4F83